MLRIGVDVGGTNVAAGIVENGVILHKKKISTEGISIFEDIARLCRELCAEKGVGFKQIVSVGLGFPGAVDPNKGQLIKAPNLKVANKNISQQVSVLLENIPVFLENDANCAALAEHHFGAARGTRSSVTVTLGTGIGGGLIIDGKIFSGAFFGAGEIGHQVIVVGGEPCGCGRRGCWEAYASATALRRAAGKSPRLIFEEKNAGCPEAAKIIDVFMEYLCEGLGNIVNIFQPEVVVVGGGISGEGQGLADEITKRMLEKVFDERSLTKFVVATLANDAGVIGASLLSENNFANS